MSDRGVMMMGGLVGAVVGVGVGFALFTARGRQLRAELQPEIDNVIREAARLTQVVEDVKGGRPVTLTGAGAAAVWPRRTV